MGELRDQLHSAFFDIRQEVGAGKRANGTDGIASDFLFDTDGAVHVKDLVEVDINSLNVDFTVGTIFDLDGRGRRRTRREAGNCVGIRCNYKEEIIRLECEWRP